MKRRDVLTTLAAALCAPAQGRAQTPTGFAFVAPARAAALAHAPATPARAALLRAADRVMGEAPKARERVHVEGTLPGQGIYEESRVALRDMAAMRDLALAARLTGRSAYGERAALFVDAWTGAYKVSFNPIDETQFDWMFLAWDMLDGERRAPLGAAMGRLLERFSRGYLDNPRRGATATNNWNSHRAKLAALAAFALGDAALVAQARAFFEAQLRANIRSDGSTIDFAERDAVHYVTYSLEPLAMAALAAKLHGEDWLSLGDGALARGFAWIAPYAEGSKTHAEFKNSRVAFDKIRNDAGVAGFSGPFDRRKTRLLMGLAARLDPAYAPLAASLRTEVWHDSWLEILLPP